MATQSGMGTAGTSGQARTGSGQSGRTASDTTYDVISVMYHALQACETYEKYAQDAEQQGNREVAQFFRDVLQQNQQCAQRGQQILLQCLQHEGGGKGQMLQGGASAQGQQGGGSSQGQQSSGSTGGSKGR